MDENNNHRTSARKSKFSKPEKDNNMENTLDHYNDDMPRKAVGKLFTRDDVENVYSDDDEANELVDSYRKRSIPTKELLTSELKPDVKDADIDDPKSKKPNPLSIKEKKTVKEYEEELTQRTEKRTFEPEDEYEYDDEDEYDDDMDEYYESNPIKTLKIALGLVSCVFLIVTAGLVFKINATMRELDEETKNIESSKSALEKMSELEIENAVLTAKVNDLSEELNNLIKLQADNFEFNIGEYETPATPQPAVVSTQTPAPTPAVANETYTVLRNDNLSKISRLFYGTSGEVQRLMNANGMTNPDDLKEGQVLIIPR